MWSNTRTFCGYKTSSYIHCIALGNTKNLAISNNSLISKEISMYWSDKSLKFNFRPIFKAENQLLVNELIIAYKAQHLL